MADVTTQPDGSAQITVTASDAAALKAMASQHLPFLARVEAWFGRDVAPELSQAAAFLKDLAANESSTLTVSASEVQSLRGLLNAHVPDFQAVLAVVESPAVRSLLTLAKDLLQVALFRRQEAAPGDEAQARKVLSDAIMTLRECGIAGVTSVGVADMLAILGAGPQAPPAPKAPPRDPQADPLTGCRSVLPG